MALMHPFDLSGKTALVTGGSRGIGLAIAEMLAKAGAEVVITGHNSPNDLHNAVEHVRTRTGQTCTALVSDASDPQAVSCLYQTLAARWKRLDILVNNAGILDDARLGMISPDRLEHMLRTNLGSALLNLQTASRLMRRGGRGGAVVTISSIIGLRGNAGQVAYAATKAGLIGMTLSAAKELGPDQIRVNAVAPGFIDTAMTAHLDQEVRQIRLDSIPLRRPGTPEDVARAVCFLASDAAGYITGQILGIDGGMII